MDTIRAVSKHTEIPPDDILGKSRRAEVVDARCILASFLLNSGLNTSEAASLMHCSDRNVRRLSRLFECRKKQHGNLIGRNAEAIRKELGMK